MAIFNAFLILFFMCSTVIAAEVESRSVEHPTTTILPLPCIPSADKDCVPDDASVSLARPDPALEKPPVLAEAEAFAMASTIRTNP